MATCATAGGNTGTGKCDQFSFIPIGAFMTPLDAKIPDNTDVMEYILQKLVDDNPAQRWYPVMNVWQIDNNSADPTEATLGAGWTRRLDSGTSAYTFSIPYKMCAARGTLKFNEWGGGVILIAKDGKLAGKMIDDGLLGAIKPKSVSVNANPIGDGQNESVTQVVMNFGDRNEFTRTIEPVSVEGMDTSLFEGIVDVKLTKKASTTTSVTLYAKVACGGENLAELYSIEIIDPACWVIQSSTGTPLTVSTATINAADNSITLNFTGTAATVRMASISALKAKGIIGYESNTLRL